MRMKRLGQPAHKPRSHLDLDDCLRPHGEELPDREVVRVPAPDVEDDHRAYEDLEG